MPEESTVTEERDGHVMLLGLNRPEKRNAFNRRMLTDLALAYRRLDRDSQVRCGVLRMHRRCAVRHRSVTFGTGGI